MSHTDCPTAHASTPASPEPLSREWLNARVAAESRDLARIDRECEARRKRLAFLAATRWVMERQAEVIILADGLSRKPAVIAAKLRSTSHGCDWLIARWKMLQRVTTGRAHFHPAERKLAQDLLATPAELRDSGTLDPRFQGLPIAEVIQSQIDELEALKAGGLEELDAMDRAAAIDGQDVLGDKPLAALKREAAACQRRMQWALKRLEAEERAERRRVPEKPAEAPIKEAAAPPPPEPGSRKARRAERRRLDALVSRYTSRPTTPDEINVVRARLGLAPLPVAPANSSLLAVSAGG